MHGQQNIKKKIISYCSAIKLATTRSDRPPLWCAYLLAVYESSFICVSKRSRIGKIKKNEEKGYYMNKESKQHNWITTPSYCPCSQDSK